MAETRGRVGVGVVENSCERGRGRRKGEREREREDIMCIYMEGGGRGDIVTLLAKCGVSVLKMCKYIGGGRAPANKWDRGGGRAHHHHPINRVRGTGAS